MNNRFIEGSPEHHLDNNQQQLNEGGTIVSVSRQALCDLLDKMESLPTSEDPTQALIAMGATHASCCQLLDEGKDPRTVECSEFFAEIIEAIGLPDISIPSILKEQDNTNNFKKEFIPAVCPWTDFKGNAIHEGDVLQHPSGQTGTVTYKEHSPYPSDNWLVDYPTGGSSRLCLQIGDKGQGVVKTKPSCFKKQLDVEACNHGCPVSDECYKQE